MHAASRQPRGRPGRRPPGQGPISPVSVTSAPARSSARTAERRSPTRSRGRQLTSSAGRRDQRLPLVDGNARLPRVDRHRVAERPGEGLELGLHDVVRLPAGQHPDVQGEVGVEREGLEDVAGQRARGSRRGRARRTAGPRARRCARSRGDRRRRPRPARAPRPTAPSRRRSGGCRPCRRAPRAAPGRARSRCPRPCGARRCGCRPRSAPSGRPASGARTRSACGRRSRHRWTRRGVRSRRGRPRPAPSTRWSPARSVPSCSSLSCSLCFHHGRQGIPERRHLVCRADRDPQPSVGSSLADQHPAIEQTLPDSMTVLEGPERTEIGIGVGHLEVLPAQPVHRRVALGPQPVDVAEQLGGVARGPRGRPPGSPRRGGRAAGPPGSRRRSPGRPRGSPPGHRPGRRPCSWCG